MPAARTRWAAAAIVAAAAVPLFVTGTANAAAASPSIAVTCSGPTSVFDVKPDNTLWLYQNTAPTTGAASWSNIHQIGTGWYGRTLAAANGDIYSITPTGDLRYLHYNLATGTWAGGYTTAGTGFSRYLSGPAASQITVDSTGTLYAIDADGNLRAWALDPTTHQLVSAGGAIVDQNWGGYSRIFAAGPGVLYAVDGGGNLLRFRLDTSAREFTEYADPVGTNWANVKNVFSPGGDVLYVTDAAGSLLWFRYNTDTHSWDNGASGKVIGSGWNTVVDASATTNTCTVPQPGAVAPTAPAAHTAADPLGLATAAPGGSPFYFWNVKGTIEYSQDSGATGLAPTQQVPGTGAVVSPLAVTNQDPSTMAAGWLDGNGEAYYVRADGGPLVPQSLGGSFTTLAVASANGQAHLFGVSADGHLWTAINTGGDAGATTAWRDLTTSLTSNGVHLTGYLSVGAGPGGDIDGAAQLSDGTIAYFTTPGSPPVLVLGALPPIDDAVVAPNTGTEVLAAASQANGLVYANNTEQGVGTFPALAALPGGAKATSVAVAQAADGVFALTTLGDDGQVYVTNSTSGIAWSAWQRLPLDAGVTAVTQPSLISSNNAGADLAVKGSDGKIWHFTAPAPAAGQAMTWTGAGHIQSR